MIIAEKEKGVRRFGAEIGRRRKILGALGEALIVKHLKTKGFTHIESNFHVKQGELDVIMEISGRLHFIEVKTVSCEKLSFERRDSKVAHKPEENVTPRKMRKIAKTIAIYLEKRGWRERAWQFDVAVVYLDRKNQKAYIKILENQPLAEI